MQWTRSETLALAQQSCSVCFGLGLRAGRAGRRPLVIVYSAQYSARAIPVSGTVPTRKSI